MEFSGYRSMWLFVMFDLPSKTHAEKKRYTAFRKGLLKDGFDMMQYSIYIRYCPSEENAEVHIKRVMGGIPIRGEVSILKITDKQFGRIKVFHGKNEQPVPKTGDQLELF